MWFQDEWRQKGRKGPLVDTQWKHNRHCDKYRSFQLESFIKPGGADYNLIDLWSADPIPAQVPTHTSSSSPVPSRSLPSSSLPVILIPSPSLVTTSPLHRLGYTLRKKESSAAPRASRPTTTSSCQPVTLTSTYHSFITSAVRLPGSSAGLDRHSRSAFSGRRPATATNFRYLGCTLTLHPFGTPGLLPSSDLPVGLPHHIVTPVIHPHVTASVLLVNGSAPVFRVYSVAIVHQPLVSHQGPASANRPQGSIRPLCLDSTLVPPPVCATMVPVANASRLQSVPSSAPSAKNSAFFSFFYFLFSSRREDTQFRGGRNVTFCSVLFAPVLG
ncbi:hypothetical protein PO909_015213 [Leuciscus waleckii]